MMYSHGSAMGWLFLLPVALLIALSLVALLAYRPHVGNSAERVLAARFAHGEIDAEEYEQRLATLRDTGI
jgi:uncharacterized membrane protein